MTLLATGSFLVAERLVPGRALPASPGWYARTLLVNFAQLAITLATGKVVWPLLFAGGSLLYLRTPGWLRFFVQTPELHSIHHQLDVHAFDYSDLPVWDRLFGTYRDAREFAPRCGFHGDSERGLGEMLLFRDVNRQQAA
jgi:sterol desaturase/sphingolipid hydroxylase (fatty acid hydroxylase superfamily)